MRIRNALTFFVLLPLIMMFLSSCGEKQKPPATTTAAAPGDAASQPAVPGAKTVIPAADAAVLTEYGAEWCPGCKQLSATLEKIKPEYAKTLIIKEVDIEKNSDVVKELYDIGFQGYIPFTVLRSSDGNVLWTTTGALPKTEIEKVLKQHGINPGR